MNHSIVVIDDEQDFLDSMNRCLLRAGIKHIRLISDPREAVDAVHNGEVFDIALIDVNMPFLDGKQVLKAIRGKTPHTICLMVTGQSDVMYAVECMKMGAVDYMQKPFTPEEFLSVIRPILENTIPGIPDRLKILVVEDEKITRRLYEIKLSTQIFEARFAEDGEQASLIYRDWKPDVILLDLMLPRKSGYMLLKEIRAEDTLTTVIIITTLGLKEDIRSCAALGIQGYIIKPVNFSELNGKIINCYGVTNGEKAKIAGVFRQRLDA
ncbi:MAG TPA: response regulator [Syntrophales bacterium]|nr:response regulator [Syntrophales bacterium]